MLLSISVFYAVISIRLDLFGSTIVDERHFSDWQSAKEYAESINELGVITITTRI